MPIMEQNKQVSSGFWRQILKVYDLFDLRDKVTGCARTLKILNASEATIDPV